MNLTKIYNRSRSLIASPRKYWPEIASEGNSRQSVVKSLLFPMSLLIGVFSITGMLWTANFEDAAAIGYLVLSGFFSFLIIYLEVYIAAWLIFEIATYLKSSTSSHQIFTLVIYSHIPFFLTLSISLIFPELMFLNVVALYSFYLFWEGIEHFTELRGENKIMFMILSSLIIIVLYILLTILFNNIYDSILNLFTTFIP